MSIQRARKGKPRFICRVLHLQLPAYIVFPFLVVLYDLLRRRDVQRQALETAHQQLAEHAATLEKLAISRERNRLARELHDTLAHTLSAATVRLNAIQVVWDARPEKAHSLLGEVIDMMNDGMVEVRRALRALRSTPLEDLGLLLALRYLARSAAERGVLQLELSLPRQFEGLHPDDEQGIYRIVQEALENVIKHADATSVKVCAKLTHSGYRFKIEDNGRGFDVHKTRSQSHFGLNGMTQRALMMRSYLKITSQLNKGTAVEFTVEQRHDTRTHL